MKTQVAENTIGARLRSLRQARGYTIEQLAAAAGVADSWINNVELGYIKAPGSIKLYAVATVLGVTIESLLERE